MTTDTTALQERIARAMHADDVEHDRAADGYEAMNQSARDWLNDNAAAVLPIIAAEVRAAKAEALREAASGLSWFGAQGNTLDHLTSWEVVGVCMKSLRDDADRIETGDQA